MLFYERNANQAEKQWMKVNTAVKGRCSYRSGTEAKFPFWKLVTSHHVTLTWGKQAHKQYIYSNEK